MLRGLHFAQTPPGQAKYVSCLRGSVYDVVVDVRVGSPTYGRWDAVTLSAQMMGIVKRMLAGEAVTQEGSGLSKREWRELMDILGRDAA